MGPWEPVVADPYPWPYDGSVPADRVALPCIDWQVDFCGPGPQGRILIPRRAPGPMK